MLLHLQRNILCRVVSRLTILISVDTEHREVAAVTRPHPVISISTEFTDRRRRRTYHTNILINGLHKKIILIRTIERLQLQADKFAGSDVFLLGESLSHLFHIRGRQVIQSFRIFILLELLHHVIGHIKNAVDKSNGKTLARQFFRAFHSPETVGQIVVLYRAVLLYVTIPAVVISKHQTVFRDDFASTTSTKMHYRIFQADAVGTVHLVNADVQTHILHHRRVLLFQIGKHPHSFVGPRS